MRLDLSENLTKLASLCPFPLYVVGGRVRDWLAGLVSDRADTDICAPASADDFIAAAQKCSFKVDAIYRNTGTVKISCGKEEYEFTSFRTDEYVRGGHVPTNIRFTDDIFADARRRDFKCNAVYYDIKSQQTVDPLGGGKDIKVRLLTAVAPPGKVFGEDGLRLMRLARIAAQTGFVPSRDCVEAATFHRGLIRDVSKERVAAELNLILQADGRYGISGAQYRGLEILKETGVLAEILPELCEGEGMQQRKDFHDHDVLEHSLLSVKYAHPSVRLAALLHDVGKPYCFKNTGKFANHEREGARIAVEILSGLRFPAKVIEETERLISQHMYDFDCAARENKVRRFILKNADIFQKLMYLKQADYSACKDDLSEAPSVKKFRYVYSKMQSEGVPFSLKELKIKGNDLIALGFPPVTVGDTLEKLLDDCCINAVCNDGRQLAERAVKVYLRGLSLP